MRGCLMAQCGRSDPRPSGDDPLTQGALDQLGWDAPRGDLKAWKNDVS